jgi:hypothetical protein
MAPQEKPREKPPTRWWRRFWIRRPVTKVKKSGKLYVRRRRDWRREEDV